MSDPVDPKNLPSTLWWALMLILVAVVWAGISIASGKSSITAGDLLIVGVLLLILFQLQRR